MLYEVITVDETLDASHRGHVDDAPASPRNHRFPDSLGEEKCSREVHGEHGLRNNFV